MQTANNNAVPLAPSLPFGPVYGFENAICYILFASRVIIIQSRKRFNFGVRFILGLSLWSFDGLVHVDSVDEEEDLVSRSRLRAVHVVSSRVFPPVAVPLFVVAAGSQLPSASTPEPTRLSKLLNVCTKDFRRTDSEEQTPCTRSTARSGKSAPKVYPALSYRGQPTTLHPTKTAIPITTRIDGNFWSAPQTGKKGPSPGTIVAEHAQATH